MIRIGMIGAGMVGQITHLANFASLPGCRVLAIAELRSELGRLAASRYEVPRLYPSHHELLADPDIDAVVVVTRRPATGPIVLDALRARKHVLSEKPMAHTVEQGARLVAAARSANVIYSIGYMKRHDAGVQHAKQFYETALKSGDYGRPLLMRVYCFNGDFQVGRGDFVMTKEPRPEGLELWPVAPDWLPASMHSDYAAFLNVFIHDLNLIRFFIGRTPAVTAVDMGHPNGRIAMLDAGDFPCILEMGEVPFPRWHEGIEIFFERGRLRVELPPPLLQGTPASIEFTPACDTPKVDLRAAPSWAFHRQAEAFITDIAESRPPIAGGADALEDLRLAEQIWSAHLSRSRH
jgi:predicted dehydrogenase